MPEFSRRFTPATCRLRELIATRLGRPRHISIRAVPPAADAPDAIPGQAAGDRFPRRPARLVPLCRPVDGRAARSGPFAARRPHEGPRSIAIEFAEVRGDIGRRPTVRLELHRPPQPADKATVRSSGVSFTVTCERGKR